MLRTFNSSGVKTSSTVSEPEEPEINFFPMNFGVPRIVPDESHPTGIIGADPHSHYTETTAFEINFLFINYSSPQNTSSATYQ